MTGITRHTQDNRITVLLDTNVFVAAYWARSSASARLMRACVAGVVQAHFSREVRAEVTAVLRQIRVSEGYMREVDAFWDAAVEARPRPVESVRSADPSDQKFLEAALGADTDFLVTNDDHLLSVGYVGRTEILKPVSVLKLIDVSLPHSRP